MQCGNKYSGEVSYQVDSGDPGSTTTTASLSAELALTASADYSSGTHQATLQSKIDATYPSASGYTVSNLVVTSAYVSGRRLSGTKDASQPLTRNLAVYTWTVKFDINIDMVKVGMYSWEFADSMQTTLGVGSAFETSVKAALPVTGVDKDTYISGMVNSDDSPAASPSAPSAPSAPAPAPAAAPSAPTPPAASPSAPIPAPVAAPSARRRLFAVPTPAPTSSPTVQYKYSFGLKEYVLFK